MKLRHRLAATAVDHGTISAQTFAVRDAGFVHHDANRDIEAD